LKGAELLAFVQGARREHVAERVNAFFVQHFDLEEEFARRVAPPQKPSKHVSPALVHAALIF
jgi:hypothetical protein